MRALEMLRELEQARTDLATVTTERNQAREGWKTTSALAVETQNDLEATRAELAKAEARVNTVRDILNLGTLDALDAALEALHD